MLAEVQGLVEEKNSGGVMVVVGVVLELGGGWGWSWLESIQLYISQQLRACPGGNIVHHRKYKQVSICLYLAFALGNAPNLKGQRQNSAIPPMGLHDTMQSGSTQVTPVSS